ncbi:MAG: hydroxylamine reductase, partial [Candidatus Methanomethylophilaceae archaeon]|nr:hydroxylamine reductase [Candidatus Methanomethylophilaceae archaeon]
GTGCTRNGVCGKSAELSDKMDELVGMLIELSVATEGCPDRDLLRDVDGHIVDSLFMTLSNTNFDKARIDDAVSKSRALMERIGRKCSVFVGDDPDYSVDGYDANEDLRSLKQLLLFGLKGLAAYYHHACVLGAEDASVTSFVRKALPCLKKDLGAEELIALNIECGEVGAKAMALLDEYNVGSYGKPEITEVRTGVGKRPGILITGHDLKDLEQLLEQTKGTGVDVYTHGEMLPAHAYPAFKKYDNLVGNYGGAWYLQKDEFERFNGPIVATTNCVLIPKDGYRDRLFTTGVAGVEGVRNIPSVDGRKDFSEVIEKAKSCQPPEQLDDRTLTIGFAHDQTLALAGKIIDAVKSGAIKRFVVMAGCDGREKGREYYTRFAEELPKDTVILTAGCAKYRYNKLDLGDIGGIPRVIDAGQCNDCYSLVVIANALADAFGTDVNGLPLSFNISWYEQKAVLVLLVLLKLGVKNIMLGPRLPVFLTPGVTKVLVDTFGIKANSEPSADRVILNIE